MMIQSFWLRQFAGSLDLDLGEHGTIVAERERQPDASRCRLVGTYLSPQPSLGKVSPGVQNAGSVLLYILLVLEYERHLNRRT